jgi:hypothetical protein
MAKVKEATAKVESKTVVYLGISIPGTALSYGNIYSNGYPETVKNLMAAMPEIKPLMIEAEKVMEFKKELGVKGSYANTLYSLLEKRVKGGK